MTGLADCNNFFVSCERTRRPELEGRAVVVLSNNDGCVVARSNEAKRAGIRMGQPAFEIRELILSGRVVALSGDHLLYRDISLKVHDIFRRYAPDTIDYSVDEAFLDMSGIPVEFLPGIGEEIWRACWEEQHIPVTVGFAPTKTLAKIITEVTKKSGDHIGVLVGEDNIRDLLQKVPIGDLWGIGRRLAKKMYLWGVYNVCQFADKDLLWVRKNLGVVGERSWRELHGEPCIELSHISRPMQDSISESRTFPEDILDYNYIRARIVRYTSDCAKKLRSMGGVCNCIGVFLQTNRFHLDAGLTAPNASITLPEATSDTSVLVEAALNILDGIYKDNVAFKRAGVYFSDIVPSKENEPGLFDFLDPATEKRAESKRLMKVVDSINIDPGASKIKLASQITKGHSGHNDGYSSSFQAPSK